MTAPALPRVSTARSTALGLAAFVVRTAGLLWWAKWEPYTGRTSELLAARPGPGRPCSTPPGSRPAPDRA